MKKYAYLAIIALVLAGVFYTGYFIGSCIVDASLKQSVINDKASYIFWFSAFAILAWYQLRHLNGFDDKISRSYTLLQAYCGLNFTFLLIGLYYGFKVVSWWFLIVIVFVPLIIQIVKTIAKNEISHGHITKKISFASLFLIPLSVWQTIGIFCLVIYSCVLASFFVPHFVVVYDRVKILKEKNYER